MFCFSLEQLYLNKNCLSSLFYPDNGCQYYESEVTYCKPFQNLRCLLLGNIMLSSWWDHHIETKCQLWLSADFKAFNYHTGDNNISDLASVDSLNLFPNLVVRLILWIMNYACLFILIHDYAWHECCFASVYPLR
jgi:hypothetical protein